MPSSGATIRQGIVGTMTTPITIGDTVNMDQGAKDTEMAAGLTARIGLDTDTTSTTYAQYVQNGNGNGMRLVMVPVNGGPPNFDALGFAGFFLEIPSTYSKLGGGDSACAYYMGKYRQGQGFPPPTGSGAVHVRLF